MRMKMGARESKSSIRVPHPHIYASSRGLHTQPSITTRIVVVTPAFDSAQAERISWICRRSPSQPTNPFVPERHRKRVQSRSIP